MKKKFFALKLFLLPGLIQLVIIQLSFMYFDIDNISMFSRFKIFTNFSSDQKRQSLVLIKKEGELPSDCSQWSQKDNKRYANTVFELERFRRNRVDLTSKYEQIYQRFSRCYDIEIRELLISKVEYQLNDSIKEERVIWKSKID